METLHCYFLSFCVMNYSSVLHCCQVMQLSACFGTYISQLVLIYIMFAILFCVMCSEMLTVYGEREVL